MFDTKVFKRSILNEAMQGKLTQQSSKDGDASDLLQSIDKEKQRLIKTGKIKKQKKLSPVRDDEIPFKIPDNWQWTRLDNVGLIISGGTPRKNKAEYWNDKYLPWITPKLLGFNQSHKLLHDTNQYISEIGLKESSAQFIEKGSIVFSSRAPIGHINIVDFDYSTSQGAKSVTPLKISRDYLYYSLKERTDAIRGQGSGTTFKEISKTALSNSLIPIPPLAEQKRIVRKIDKCFKWASLINQEQKLTQEFDDDMYKSLLQSAMQGRLTQQLPQDGDASDLLQSIDEEKQRLIKSGKIKKQKELSPVRDEEKPFSIPDNWQWARLGDIGLITSGGTPRRSNPEYWNAKSIPWITPKLLGSNQNHKLLHDVDQYISEIGLKESSAQFIEKGSIVFSSRAPIGYINIVDFNYSTNQGAKSITPFKINQTYLYYSLKERTEAIKKQGSGTTFKEISKTALSNFLISIPPLAEQKRIVDKLDSMLGHIDNM